MAMFLLIVLYNS